MAACQPTVSCNFFRYYIFSGNRSAPTLDHFLPTHNSNPNNSHPITLEHRSPTKDNNYSKKCLKDKKNN